MLKPLTTTSADRFCALLVGPAGIGKTSQLRTLYGQDWREGAWAQVEDAKKAEKVLVLSAESGLICVRDLVASGAVKGFEIMSLSEFKEALAFCQSAEFKKEGCQWVFVDSLTEIASRCAEELQKKYPNKADGFKMWGEYNTIMTDLVKAFRDLSTANVIFTCLLTYEKDDVGRRFPAPDIAGSTLKNRLPSYFDEVLVMSRETLNTGTPENPMENDMLVFCTRTPVGLAKDRSGKLAEYEYPNLLSIKRKILG